MKHLIESQQFDTKQIRALFSIADRLDKKRDHSLRGKVLATLFYEPSTRTRLSFEAAALRLGGTVISTENAREFSSAAKGETLEDSIRIVGGYADAIVLRHYEEGASARAAAVSNVPIINAGDGIGQHPSQALLDLYTIRRELGRIDGITIALVGDLKHGRTIRSLAYLLGKYRGVTIHFVSPRALRVREDITAYLDRHAVRYTETEDIEAILPEIDVFYQTRIQKERFPSERAYKKYKGCYKIDSGTVARMKPKSIIMHPLPRIDEIAPEVDASPKAAYFRQARYGLLVRMALLKLLLSPRAK